MKSPDLPASVWLVALGTAATVMVGALAHFDTLPAPPSAPAPAPAPAALEDQADGTQSAGEPALPADLSPGLAEIIRLAEAHVDDGVILAYIRNSGQTYAPTAEEILYLSDLGLSQNVLAALFNGKPAPAPPVAVGAAEPPAAAPPSALPPAVPEANTALFATELAPYGAWLQLPQYGDSWQPTVAVLNPDWQPYLDHGQWLDTDSGWYWQSDYSWGWAAFHYGGWVKAPRYGWVWVPGKVWAPAWVGWRSAPSYIGWAPLPPGVGLNMLAQLTFNGHLIAAGFDFGLVPSSFVFVSANNFLSRNLPGRVVPRPRAAALVSASATANNYAVVNHKFINGGVSRDEVAAAVGQPVREVVLHPVSTPPGAAAGISGKSLAVYRPDAAAASASSESAPFLLNKPAASSAPAENPALLASAPTSDPAPSAAADAAAGQPVQLPPLRFGGPRRDNAGQYVKSSVGETAAARNRTDAGTVERPRSAAPRLEGASPAPRAVETPSRPAPRAVEAPSRPPPPEPARAVAPPEPARAAVSPAPSASSASKSSK